MSSPAAAATEAAPPTAAGAEAAAPAPAPAPAPAMAGQQPEGHTLDRQNRSEKVIEEKEKLLQSYISQHYNKIREVESELKQLQLQVKLTSAPKRQGLEMLRRKIEVSSDKVMQAKKRFDGAKKAMEDAEAALKKEEGNRAALCMELNNLIQENAEVQFQRLDELTHRLEDLNNSVSTPSAMPAVPVPVPVPVPVGGPPAQGAGPEKAGGAPPPGVTGPEGVGERTAGGAGGGEGSPPEQEGEPPTEVPPAARTRTGSPSPSPSPKPKIKPAPAPVEDLAPKSRGGAGGGGGAGVGGSQAARGKAAQKKDVYAGDSMKGQAVTDDQGRFSGFD